MGCTVGKLCKCCVFPGSRHHFLCSPQLHLRRQTPRGKQIAEQWDEFARLFRIGNQWNERLLWLECEGGDRVPAMHIRPDDVAEPDLTVLFSHGNGANLPSIHEKLKKLAQQHRVAVFAYEYSGYYISQGGGPSERALYRNVEAAFKYLTEDLSIPRNQIVLWGHSLGSGPAVQ